MQPLNSKHLPPPRSPVYLSLYLSQSFLPRPVRCMISFVCLHLHPPLPPIIMLFELLSLQHGGIKAFLLTGSRGSSRASPLQSRFQSIQYLAEVEINIFSPIQNDTGGMWGLYPCRLHCGPINAHKGNNSLNKKHTHKHEIKGEIRRQ